jgi:hypothetical protein
MPATMDLRCAICKFSLNRTAELPGWQESAAILPARGQQSVGQLQEYDINNVFDKTRHFFYTRNILTRMTTAIPKIKSFLKSIFLVFVELT